ncbi:MAG TPA: murein biosynthesis integral membrane protein MurJ, partial [Ktedonobacteraceae bacterium]|nr:murein biosynthesis integral membrane protein MurJ [Ktedonobacteraceae bacterium]
MAGMTSATIACKKERTIISHTSEDATKTSATVATSDRSEAAVSGAAESAIATSARRRERWLSGAFRLDPRRFLPGRGAFSLRRFSITEAALLLMAAYCASKGLGAIRQILFNYLFGVGLAANAYTAAVRLPETLFDLIAGGALVHALVPVFLSHEEQRGQRELWRLASLVFNILLISLSALALIAELIAPVFVSKLLVPGYPPAEQALTTSLTRIMLLQTLILGLGTVATAILATKRQFILPALSIALYDVGIIIGLLCTMAFPKLGIYGPAWGVVGSAVIQVLVLLPGLVRRGARYSFFWNIRYPALRDVLRLLAPNVLMVAVASVGFIIDTAFISFMPQHASLAAAHNAHLLFSFPQTLFAVAIGQAALPTMAALVTARRYERLRRVIIKLLSGAFILSIVASLMLYLFGKPIIHLLFQHGAFGKHATALTSTALLGYAFALPALTIGTLLVVIFYAMQDAKPPLVATILGVAAHWGLLVFLMHTLTGNHVILAIPLAAAAEGVVQTVFLGALLVVRLRSKVRLDRAMQRLARWKRLPSTEKPYQQFDSVD